MDQRRATDAGRALFEVVHEAWAQLPEDQRPALVTYGMSLGAAAAQAPFGDVGDMVARTDGALFVGPPHFTQPWSTITGQRDAGSPQWQPVYDGGRTVRFAATAADLAGSEGTWPAPRVVYLQHASDPVVWWGPDLALRRPDWLAEPRGPDVSPATRWIPIITFLHVAVDQLLGVSVPAGHGHNYVNTVVQAWTTVLRPPGWTDEQTAQLQRLITPEVAE